MGDLQKALDDYTAGINKGAFAGLSGELYIRRAKFYLTSGEADKALADLNQALTHYPANMCPQAYRLRAEAYHKLGRPDLALADEAKASKLPPSEACVKY
jgi:tetratricopeptide (TPR) repeat protein